MRDRQAEGCGRRAELMGLNSAVRLKRLSARLLHVLPGVLLTLSLGGCGTKMTLDDTVRSQQLVSERKGIVLLALDVEGAACTAGAIHLATEGPAGKLKKFQHFSTLGAKTNVAQIELPEGTYHLGVVACVQGHRVVNVGTHDGSALIGDPLKSMGAFKVAAGEVINLGHVVISRRGEGSADATLHVVAMNTTTIDLLKAQVPKLHARSKVRLLAANPAEHYNFSAELLPQGGSRTTYIPIYRR